MTERFQLYKCEVCENITEIIRQGTGQLVCCGQPMRLCMANKDETIRENHIPLLERASNEGLMVKVGITEHPMAQKHYVEWIEIIAEDRACRQFLKPGDNPIALFDKQKTPLIVREYCNQHGLWKGYIIMNNK